MNPIFFVNISGLRSWAMLTLGMGGSPWCCPSCCAAPARCSSLLSIREVRSSLSLTNLVMAARAVMPNAVSCHVFAFYLSDRLADRLHLSFILLLRPHLLVHLCSSSEEVSMLVRVLNAMAVSNLSLIKLVLTSFAIWIFVTRFLFDTLSWCFARVRSCFHFGLSISELPQV